VLIFYFIEQKCIEVIYCQYYPVWKKRMAIHCHKALEPLSHSGLRAGDSKACGSRALWLKGLWLKGFEAQNTKQTKRIVN